MPVSRGGKPASSSKPNPFDSDSDSEDFTSKKSSTAYKAPADAKKRYKDGFRDSGGLENQSVQELENYAAGEQISRTHEKAVEIDQDLTKGETLLGSLGGFFSKPWKPKKTRKIKGPAMVSRDDSFKKKASRMEQRDKLGLSPRGKPDPRHYGEATSAMDKVQLEKKKQDDALDDLSGVLGQLKGMAVDMGSELDRQNEALDHLQGDVDELNSRVKGANQRARKLIEK
ncbi:hypothetical protein QOZ80_2AG0132700 [Eleusine coracana subsp. coracana]|nr:hypothetical protein QOZ80_2AG0132700 [Eleusine coracana subsp. coracana]